VKISYRLSMPRDAATVPLVRALCHDAMTRLGVSLDDVDDVDLAITEACTNVVVHAAGGVAYEVHVELVADDCRIRVIDSGGGFTAGEGDRAMPRASETQGRGIALMDQLMDQIQVDARAEVGTIVHLYKHLHLGSG
jgi:serine/threonine-protein kinase RsbW